VKTTGEEEFNSAYTRNRSIALPESFTLATDERRDFFLLAHELFHVLSRENPGQRHALYALLGFERLAKFEYPRSSRNAGSATRTLGASSVVSERRERATRESVSGSARGKAPRIEEARNLLPVFRLSPPEANAHQIEVPKPTGSRS